MWWSPGRLPPLRHPAAGRGSSAAAPSGDRDPADHAGGDRAPSASVGVSLLLHQHMRHLAGGRGSDPFWAQAQCLGGSAGQCLSLEFQQDPGASGSATGGRDQLRDNRKDPPGSERRAGAADESGHRLCPSAAGGLRR